MLQQPTVTVGLLLGYGGDAPALLLWCDLYTPSLGEPFNGPLEEKNGRLEGRRERGREGGGREGGQIKRQITNTTRGKENFLSSLPLLQIGRAHV